MTFADIANVLKDKFSDKIVSVNSEGLDPHVEVAPEAIAEVSLFCRDDDRLRFEYLRNLSGADWFVLDEKRAKKVGIEPHVEVIYHLFSFAFRHFLVLKVKLPRWKDNKVGEIPELPSVHHVWKIADWHERECFDLVGVRFVGHPNLMRILCADDWVGHPLRKDYEFPLEYHGIRAR